MPPTESIFDSSRLDKVRKVGPGRGRRVTLKSAKGPVAGPPNIGGTREVTRHRSSVLRVFLKSRAAQGLENPPLIGKHAASVGPNPL